MPDLNSIAELRAITGAPMMDCKKALEEAGGDLQKAQDILRKTGALKSAKREGKVAAEGVIASYIHSGSRIGVLLELNCETDFVAKTPGFAELAKELCLHIAAANPLYVSHEAVSAGVVENEKEIYRVQLKSEGKPEAMIEKIIEGKLAAFFKDVCLLEQPYVRDDSKTVKDLLDAKVAELGEKITVRRFVRYALGEGIQKQETDFAKEVEEQLKG